MLLLSLILTICTLSEPLQTSSGTCKIDLSLHYHTVRVPANRHSTARRQEAPPRRATAEPHRRRPTTDPAVGASDAPTPADLQRRRSHPDPPAGECETKEGPRQDPSHLHLKDRSYTKEESAKGATPKEAPHRRRPYPDLPASECNTRGGLHQKSSHLHPNNRSYTKENSAKEATPKGAPHRGNRGWIHTEESSAKGTPHRNSKKERDRHQRSSNLHRQNKLTTRKTRRREKQKIRSSSRNNGQIRGDENKEPAKAKGELGIQPRNREDQKPREGDEDEEPVKVKEVAK